MFSCNDNTLAALDKAENATVLDAELNVKSNAKAQKMVDLVNESSLEKV